MVFSESFFFLSLSSLRPASCLTLGLEKEKTATDPRTDRKLFSVGCVALPPLRKTSPFHQAELETSHTELTTIPVPENPSGEQVTAFTVELI